MQTQKRRPEAATSARRNDNPVDVILSRLDGVKQRGARSWAARCPVHDDRHPSLSVKEADDGKVLLHCWTGCSAVDIVAALGLSFADLFPDAERPHDYTREALRSRGPLRRWGYREALDGIAHETMVALLIVEAIRDGHPLSGEDAERLALAQERIDDALRLAGGGQ